MRWIPRRRARRPEPHSQFRPTLEALEDRLVPAVYTVHNAVQLAAAITAADAHPGSTINLTPGTAANNYLLTSALPGITANMTLQGTGTKATQVVIDGQNVASPDFQIGANFKTVTFKNMEITGGNAVYGGGIATRVDNLVLNNVIVTENNATHAGGGIYQYGGNLTMTNSQITNNTAGTHGGGYMNAAGYGGTGTPISFEPYATVISITSSTVGGNTALTGDGGGIYVGATGTLSITSSHIDGNQAGGGFGGGILTNDFTAKITGSTVNGNISAGHGGGIADVYNHGNITLTSSQVNNNQSQTSGGGLYLSACTLTMNSSTVDGNTCFDGDGGGVYFAQNLLMTNSHIDNNTSEDGGGGVMLLGYPNVETVTLTGSTINGNDATGTPSYGGGFWGIGAYTMTLNNSSVTNNRAGHGGGIALAGNGTFGSAISLTLNNSHVDNNTGVGSGGGIHAASGRNGGSISITLNSGSTVNGNHAGGYGGGIDAFAKDGGTINLTVSHSTVNNNVAGTWGGGIGAGAFTTGSINITLSASTVNGNVAGGKGGGIAAYGGAGFFNPQVGLFYGGSVTLSINQSTIASNRAGSSGGGLFVSRGFNEAPFPPFFDLSGSATLTMTASTVNNNSASGAGGGLFLQTTGSGATVTTLVNDTISNNIAQGNGGGVEFAASCGNVNIVNITDAANRTLTGHGGGLSDDRSTNAIDDATINVGNSIIALNTAGTGATTYDDAFGTNYSFFTTGPFAVTGGGPNLVTSLASAPGFAGDPGLVTGNPQLGPLANNGGPTQTRAITAASPAAFHGSYALDQAFASLGALNDQRGIRRVPPNPPGKPDLGAYD